MVYRLLTVTLLLTFVSAWGCKEDNISSEVPGNLDGLVNSAHLDDLYEEIVIGEDTMAIIHIYSEYPDYAWLSDDDEGASALDDVARAAIFYMMNYQSTGDEQNLLKVKRLLSFILHMQANSGFFYNFIWDDHTKNRTFKTSVPQPNWWTWRAMWALSEGYPYFESTDKVFADRMTESLKKAADAIKDRLPISTGTKSVAGFEVPTWLPGETASDQAAVMILGLLNYYEITGDAWALEYIRSLANGMMLMQAGDSSNFPFNAFLSWENIWHAYGNSQAHALLKAGKQLNEPSFIQSGLDEVTDFYPYMIENNLSDFAIKVQNDEIINERSNKYPQIAYNYRPMVLASLEAYEITGDEKYAEQAGKIACWLFGNNIDNAKMYFSESGICFDGISGSQSVNQNSGAESTIEALLILQAIEQNQIAKQVVMDYINR